MILTMMRGGAGDDTYRNRFGYVRDSVAIVPRATAAAHSATALGRQTALVVGLPDAIATTTQAMQPPLPPPSKACSNGPRGMEN